jgi:hypothetical protein
MLVGRFPKLESEHVSDNMVLCTRLDKHEGIPVNVTKAKVPFLTIALYRQYLATMH